MMTFWLICLVMTIIVGMQVTEGNSSQHFDEKNTETKRNKREQEPKYGCLTPACEDCKPGFYGLGCRHKCPANCDTTCSITGVCDQCKSGFWHDDCSEECPKHCSRSCNQTSGACFESCDRGWYGDHCNKSCPKSCLEAVCNRFNGKCTRGCKNGWTGTKCEKPCPQTCLDSICNLNDYCVDGCVDGYAGDSCSDPCMDGCMSCSQQDTRKCYSCMCGRFGTNCSKTCSKYCSNTSCPLCDNNGTCLHGCKARRYGNRCKKNCRKNCVECHRKTGNCTKCSTGWFGDDCGSTCENCAEGACRNNGECMRGCVDGRRGKKCLEHVQGSSSTTQTVWIVIVVALALALFGVMI